MDRKDNVCEQCAALAPQRKGSPKGMDAPTRMVERWLCWGHRLWRVAAVAALGLALACPYTVQAKTFRCSAGDVQCLRDAINEANANGQTNTIRLQAGTYALTTVDNNVDGPNGLPSITSTLVITGAGATATRIERKPSAPPLDTPELRLLHVAATGRLTLNGLTLQGGFLGFHFPLPFPSPGNGGGIANRGTLTLTNCALTDNDAENFSGRGGGIYNTGMTTIINRTIESNAASVGGGLCNDSGTVLITNSTISDNDDHGIATFRGRLTITNSILAGNRGGLGGYRECRQQSTHHQQHPHRELRVSISGWGHL